MYAQLGMTEQLFSSLARNPTICFRWVKSSTIVRVLVGQSFISYETIVVVCDSLAMICIKRHCLFSSSFFNLRCTVSRFPPPVVMPLSSAPFMPSEVYLLLACWQRA